MPQQVVHDIIENAIGAVSASAAKQIATKWDASRLQGGRIKKMKAFMSYEGKTDGEGPIIVGLTHGLSVLEVAEALVADPQGEDDVPAIEESNRPVYPIWVIVPDGTESSRSPLNLYRTIKYPWKRIPEGVALNWFVFSRDALTTGITMDISSVTVLEWERD